MAGKSVSRFPQHAPTLTPSGDLALRSARAIFRTPFAGRGAPRLKIRVGPALGGAPRDKRGVARAPRGAAQAAGGAPRAIWAAPQVIGGGPLLVWAAPLLKRAAPRTLRGTPHLKNRAPRAIGGAPRGVWAAPRAIWAAPRAVWGGALFAEKRPFSTKNAVLPPFQPLESPLGQPTARKCIGAIRPRSRMSPPSCPRSMNWSAACTAEIGKNRLNCRLARRQERHRPTKHMSGQNPFTGRAWTALGAARPKRSLCREDFRGHNRSNANRPSRMRQPNPLLAHLAYACIRCPIPC